MGAYEAMAIVPIPYPSQRGKPHFHRIFVEYPKLSCHSKWEVTSPECSIIHFCLTPKGLKDQIISKRLKNETL